MITEKTVGDTVKLLRECDAGAKTAIKSLDEVLDTIENQQLKKILLDSKNAHRQIKAEIELLLIKDNQDGKEPSPIAKAMSWTKINLKIISENSDKAVADLMTDGCDMGIKTLTKYKNEYKNANKDSVDIADKLISLEKDLEDQLKKYL